MEVIERIRRHPLVWLFGLVAAVGSGAIGAYLFIERQLEQLGSEKLSGISIQQHRADTIPKGGILIFDTSNGCPSGWTNIAVAEPEIFAGRTIVAVGKARKRRARQYRDTGGDEVHHLTASELPKHRHGISSDFIFVERANVEKLWDLGRKDLVSLIIQEDGKDDGENCIDCPKPYFRDALTATDDKQKRGKLQKNMPPFVALYLCRRE